MKSGIRQPSPAKNAMMSTASSSGCSSAAKWPPFGMRVRPRMSVKVRAASERGGLSRSAGRHTFFLGVRVSQHRGMAPHRQQVDVDALEALREAMGEHRGDEATPVATLRAESLVAEGRH